MAIVYHMVHYRHFELNPPVDGNLTFESLCRSALNSVDDQNTSLWERAKDRIYMQNTSDGREILLNRVADLSSAVFGEMCLVQTGGLQALLNLKPSTVQLSNITTAQIYSLDERSAPAGSHFIRGIAYWLAIENHAFFVKTQAMTAESIRLYFEWLFKDCTQFVGKDNELVLKAEFDKWPAAGFEDTEISVFMEPEAYYGASKVYG